MTDARIDEATAAFRAALTNDTKHVDLNTPALQRAFFALPEYSWSVPTGVHDWKLWRAQVADGVWWLKGYVPHDATHSRLAGMPVFVLPEGARVVIEDGHVLVRHRGRELYYGRRGVNVHLLQGDAWWLDGGGV